MTALPPSLPRDFLTLLLQLSLFFFCVFSRMRIISLFTSYCSNAACAGRLDKQRELSMLRPFECLRLLANCERQRRRSPCSGLSCALGGTAPVAVAESATATIPATTSQKCLRQEVAAAAAQECRRLMAFLWGLMQVCAGLQSPCR